MDLQGEAVEEPETTPEREAASRPPPQLQVGHLYLKLIVTLQGSIVSLKMPIQCAAHRQPCLCVSKFLH